MAKKTNPKTSAPNEETAGTEPVAEPKNIRRVGDSACMTSHEELCEIHGEDVLKANVAAAKKQRQG